MSQAPQWVASVARSTHAPAHVVCAGVQCSRSRDPEPLEQAATNGNTHGANRAFVTRVRLAQLKRFSKRSQYGVCPITLPGGSYSHTQICWFPAQVAMPQPTRCVSRQTSWL